MSTAKFRTLSRSLPFERLLAGLGPQEVDLYREEKAEAGPERQRTRGFHPTFTRFCAPSIRREERLLFARVFPLRACWLSSIARRRLPYAIHRPSRHHGLVEYDRTFSTAQCT